MLVFRFASLATRAFITMGIPVHLFSALVPTPYIPFSVCRLKTKAGIMITASHNPKEDNGYKVYWENGAQVCPNSTFAYTIPDLVNTIHSLLTDHFS